SMDSDTQSSSSRSNPQETASVTNDTTKTDDGETQLRDSTGSSPKVGNVVDSHKENKLCVEKTQERERDREAEVRRRGTVKIASQQALGQEEKNEDVIRLTKGARSMYQLGQQRSGQDHSRNRSTVESQWASWAGLNKEGPRGQRQASHARPGSPANATISTLKSA
ncbi:hypothetical protein Dimus_000640, partial [Dionaea muscipula]